MPVRVLEANITSKADVKGFKDAEKGARDLGAAHQASSAHVHEFTGKMEQSSKVMGHHGEAASGLSSKLGALNSAGFTPATAGALGLGVAIGGIVEGAKSSIEITEKREVSEKSLNQAMKVNHADMERGIRFTENFRNTNIKFVKSQAEVNDLYALLLQSGRTQAQAEQDMGHILDRSIQKHQTLNEAGNEYVKVTHGKFKGVMDLDITTQALSKDDMVLENAIKAVNTAQAKSTTAHQAHEAALKAQKLLLDGLNPAHARTKVELDRIAAAQDLVTSTSANMTKADEDLVAVKEKEKDSMSKVDKALEEYNKKTEHGRETAGKMTQAQNQLNGKWEDFAVRIGPPLIDLLTHVLEIGSWLVDKLNEIGRSSAMSDFFAMLQRGLMNQLEPLKKAIDGFRQLGEAFNALRGGNFALAEAKFNAGMAHFDKGGTVPGPIGQPMLAVVHGGETITPVGGGHGGGGGGGNVVINIYPPAGVSASDIASAMSRELAWVGKAG